MKALVVLLIALGTACASTGKAQAGTLIPVLTPDNAVAYPGYPSLHGCQAETFNADDTSNGFCYRSKTLACSGRGCQPVVNTEYFRVAWDVGGNSLISLSCGTRRHHNPQADVWVYQAGYDASNCRSPALSSDTTVYIAPYTYYYFATSPSGQYELVRGNAGPFIYQF